MALHPWFVGASLLALPTIVGAAAHDRDDPYLEAWRWACFTSEDGLPSDQVWDVAITSSGLWAATEEGLARFDG